MGQIDESGHSIVFLRGAMVLAVGLKKRYIVFDIWSSDVHEDTSYGKSGLITWIRVECTFECEDGEAKLG